MPRWVCFHFLVDIGTHEHWPIHPFLLTHGAEPATSIPAAQARRLPSGAPDWYHGPSSTVEIMMAAPTQTFQSVEDVFKYAILVESRGYEFYKATAERTDNDVARRFFEEFAQEELDHKRILADLYKTWRDESRWDEELLQTGREHGFDIHDPILSQAFKKSLSTTTFDTTALDIAIVLEKEARDFYAKAAQQVEDPELRKILIWLSQFEDEHYDTMVKLHESLREEYWHDNNFWPF
jgi:rubrerythrin